MVGPDGEQYAIHHKSKLIAFGETLSYLRIAPPVYDWMKEFLGSAHRPVRPGSGTTAITLQGLGGGVTLVPLICYETVFAPYVASGLSEGDRPTFLVGLIYDGWFGRTVLPRQHNWQSALRAVENRSVAINVQNTGPSVIYLPNGAPSFVTPIGKAGGFLAEAPLIADQKRTLFSRFPWWFSGLIQLSFFGFLVLAVASRVRDGPAMC